VTNLGFRLILAYSDLLRRLSPRDTTLNLNRITTLVPDLTEDLLSAVDQPLDIRRCAKSGRDYLLCDYNRDGDSYRSPWSNEFDPPIEDGTVPSERIRKLEVAANEAFDVYRGLYYEGGVGSTYFWDLDDGFAGVVLLKKGAHTILEENPFEHTCTSGEVRNEADTMQLSRQDRKAQQRGTAYMSSKPTNDQERRTTSLRALSSSIWRTKQKLWAK
jgi:F-actin capping protein, beta subunit